MDQINKDSFVPHILLDDDNYNVFLDLILDVANDIRSIISVFPEIVDIDNAPEIFLPKLGMLIKYEYRYDIDVDIQREIIKRIIHIYKSRGTDDAIIMAATYGDDNNWIGDHVFLPDSDTSKTRATILHPTDEVFRFNLSSFSGHDKIQGPILWRSGTILIKLPHLNDDIIKAVRRVVPAGIRIYYLMASEISIEDDPYDDETHIDGIVSFGDWSLDNYTDISMELVPKEMQSTILLWSTPNRLISGYSLWSGSKGYISVFEVNQSGIYPSDNGYSVSEVEDLTIRNSRGFDIPDQEVKLFSLD